MRIQGKRIWIAGQFMAASLLVENGIIKQVAEYGSAQEDVDYGDKRVLPGFIDIHPMELMISTQTMESQRVLEGG